MFSDYNISRLIRVVGYVIVSITFVFLVNNFLNYWVDWPGVKKLLANYGLFGFEKLKNPISGSLFTYSLFQLFFYIISIFLVIFFVSKTPNQTLDKDSEILSSLSAYIIRSAFWAVFTIGLIDLIISFLATEKLLAVIFNEQIHLNLIIPSFRIQFIHLPLIFISMILGYFTRTSGFIWLAILVLFAEFSIVITRFIFSYEQAFMGDLVRFWYGALFLGIPLCLTIIFLGMSNKASIINSPLLSFEITQQGTSGLYVKYLMAAFLAIFALSMLTQFTSYFMKNSFKILNNS